MLANTLRKKLCVWLFEQSKIPYTLLMKGKKKAWDLSVEDLLNFPKESLGFALGKFLQFNGFQLIPKLERHDAFHVLTGFGTSVENEIALQYFLLGNGKKSLYLLGVTSIGLLLLPEYHQLYAASYQKGTHCGPVYKLDIREHLNSSLNSLQLKYHLICHS
jgi:ubiquinone biosynthesis protein Coq4